MRGRPGVYRIGYLRGTNLSASSPTLGAFGQGLRDLGYVEGKNLLIIISKRGEKFVYPRGRAGASQGGRDRYSGATNTRRQGSDDHDSHSVFAGSRSGWKRVCDQSGPTVGNITGLSSMSADLAGKAA